MPDATTDLVDRLLTEGPIGPAAAARLYGSYRSGRPTHPSTVVRHIQEGVRLADGTTLRLEGVRIGGRLVTSRAAVVRFVAAQQPAAAEQPAATPPRSPAQRATAADAAGERLKALGC
ncbi:DUF1580 domain-containing protein [Urbifossiella limnaea]|uniref:Uncharacterized protein n=1 Tax=Urbifossiella limnaea TaxID=2528023 RepID=A0A517XWE3_9BACT|nr:DUF1580 domain-containing protein [Urbifossiella limnaea]QDU21822.1 hypothetical protein ETAA1_37950 [Urbifossiella limnaea]